ncbi:hypothetical protein CAEBREN_00443 [Caenorhabditis brenneri]|uniref:Uncharacterized protein n=1 Tax=Caenorhabditis brenneri TaxID=135651 RepID=G0NHS0_CAEBE|nr:hypothetical protein CAEBREN_00443 [Caenorhabditis brenneri]
MKALQIVYSSIIALTLMLSFKLFVWNKCKKLTINVELKRANRLAVIDACIIVIFDLTPTIITSRFSYLFPYIGPWNAFFKMLGFVVEGNLVVINLKKRYKDDKRTSKLFLAAGKQDSGKS